jgi:hypothetical protein
MTPDFLPLDVGNLWRYEVINPGGSTETMEVEILDHIIVDATSMYVFSRFPLAPETPVGENLGIRYEGRERQFVWYDGTRFVDLFPAIGATAEVLETDDQGIPSRAKFGFDALEITLERGVGIVEARMGSGDDVPVARLIGARVGGEVIGGVETTRGPVRAGGDLVVAESTAPPATPDEVDPVLSLEAMESGEVHRFVLEVRNPSDRLLPFDFTTSQSFDFVVVEPERGEEIWRWSTRRYFSEVVRSEAIRPRSSWTFEGEWNHRDGALEPVDAGVYEVYAILAANEPMETGRIEFTVD